MKEVNGLNLSFDGASIQGISVIIIHPYGHQQSCLQYKWLVNSILTSYLNTSCYAMFMCYTEYMHDGCTMAPLRALLCYNDDMCLIFQHRATYHFYKSKLEDALKSGKSEGNVFGEDGRNA